MISFNDLIYFETVAKCNSITAATEELYISQQALSASISKLEDYFGNSLFIRTSHGVCLTETGKSVYAVTQEIINQLQELEKIACCTNNNSIEILYMPYMVLHEILLYKTKQLFQKKYPDIVVKITAESDLKKVNPNDFTFICFNTHYMTKYNSLSLKQLRNFKAVSFHNDQYCLVLNKSFQKTGTCILNKLLTLNDAKASEYFSMQLQEYGYVFQGEIENSASLEDILAIIALCPTCASIVPQIALHRYKDVKDNFDVIPLPDFQLTHHVIAYNKYCLQQQPYIKDFLELFLSQCEVIDSDSQKGDMI